MGGPSPGHLLLTDAPAPPAPAPAPNYNSQLAVLQFFVFLTWVLHTKLLFTLIFHLPPPCANAYPRKKSMGGNSVNFCLFLNVY